LAGERLAVQEQPAVPLLGAAKQLTRGVHARLRAALGATDPFELRLALDPAALHDGLPVGRDLDPLGREPVGKQERKRRRDGGLLDAETLVSLVRGLERDFLPRASLLARLVVVES